MGSPASQDVHVSAPLTDMSVAYVQKQDRFIADKVFKMVPVDHKSDQYYVFDKGDFARDEAQKRAPATKAARGGYRLSTDTYTCEKYSFAKPISDDERGDQDPALDADQASMQYVTQKMLIKREVLFAAAALGTGKWAGQADQTGVSSNPSTNQFKQFDQSGSVPLAVFEQAIEAVETSSGGMKPNTLVLGPRVWRALKNHADLVDRIKYTSGDAVALQLLARLLELDNVYVARAIKNAAAEGVTASMSFIAGAGALVAYVAPQPGKMIASAGYGFAWKGLPGINTATAMRIRKKRLDEEDADLIEGNVCVGYKLTGTDCGAWLDACVA